MKRYIVNTLLFVVDLIFMVAMYHGVVWLRESIALFHDLPLITRQEDFSLVFVLVSLILFYENIYKYRFDFWEETRRILKALFLSFMIVLAFLMLSRIDTQFSRSFLVLYFVMLAFFLPIVKRYVKKALFLWPYFRKKVKIIGNKEQKEALKQEFRHNWYLGLQCVARGHEAIFIATKDLPIDTLNAYLNEYMKDTKDLYILPYMAKVNLAEANMVEYFNLRTSAIHIENELLKARNIFLKEVFEKVMMLLILPFFSILHGIMVLLIRSDSKGSVFFKQERLGKNNTTFVCLKYRTMYENGEAILKDYLKKHPEEALYYAKYHKYQNDPRITKIGAFLRKSSLDELPQIINVLKGEMSLVGPRPYMLEEAEKLHEELPIILLVKPGITGLWQVSGRNHLTFEKRKELDVWYIQNWSLWSDFIILLKTIKVVLNKKGAR